MGEYEAKIRQLIRAIAVVRLNVSIDDSDVDKWFDGLLDGVGACQSIWNELKKKSSVSETHGAKRSGKGD